MCGILEVNPAEVLGVCGWGGNLRGERALEDERELRGGSGDCRYGTSLSVQVLGDPEETWDVLEGW